MECSTLGKYEIRSVIGRGAVGIVYEGWDPTLARKVAVKTLPLMGTDEEGREKQVRFLREARAAASLYHPNIVAVYDYGETESLAYIVMELIGGRPLDTVLEHGARPPPGEVAAIMEGMLAGLQHSHERGVVHRDIKPANIVLSNAGVVKITDFGIAHIETSEMTRVGSVMGTPAYMAPEQVLGEAVDARTDVYAAGVVLYQMLLGRRPFEGGTASIMHKIVNAPPNLQADLLDGTLPGIAAVLGKALAKRPDDRYASAKEFSQVLRAEFGPAGVFLVGKTDDATVVARPGTLSGGTFGGGVGTVMRDAAAAAPGMAAGVSAPPTTPAVDDGPQRQGTRRSLPLALMALAGVLLIGGGGWWALHRTDATLDVAATQGLPSSQALPIAPLPPPADTPSRRSMPAAETGTVDTAEPQISSPQPELPTANVPATGPPAVAAVVALPEGHGRAALQAALNEAAGTLPCSLLLAESGPDGLVVNGLTALGDASGMQIQAGLRRIVAQAADAPQVAWNIRRIDGPYCSVLDTLRAARGGSGGQGPQLILAGQPGPPMEGAPIDVSITLPAGASLVMDLYTADRFVTHLPLTAAQNGRVTFPAPRGIGLVTLLASPTPLIAPGRTAREPAAAYLEDLRSDLSRARGQGERVMVGTLVAEGRPR